MNIFRSGGRSLLSCSNKTNTGGICKLLNPATTAGYFEQVSVNRTVSARVAKLLCGGLVKGAACSLLLLASVSAASYVVPNASPAALSSAISAAADGDTLLIPDGVGTFTNSIICTKALSIQAQHFGSVTWIDAVASRAGMFQFDTTTPSAGNRYELLGIEIRATNSVTAHNNNGLIQATGNSSAIRFGYLNFYNPYGHCIQVFGNVKGVTDHCNFSLHDNNHGVRVWHTTWGNIGNYGDNSWATLAPLGTTNAWYVESCGFSNTNSPNATPGAGDGFSGARVAWRFNTLTNCHIEFHGLETGGRHRGTRTFEIYGNTLASDALFLCEVFLRSGSGVVCSNVGNANFQGSVAPVNYLTTDPFWFDDGTSTGANGLCQWHVSDGVLYATGACSAGVNAATLTVAGTPWTAHQWIGYCLLNKSRTGFAGALGWPFSEINDNTANTITFKAASHVTNMVWSTGDTYEIRKVTFAMDQVGRGTGNLISGDTPTPIGWPNEVQDTLYCWRNTVGGVVVPMGNSGYMTLVEGRDFTNGIVKPGWVPLTFPHPLITSTPPVTNSVSPGTITGTARLQGGIHLGVMP